MSSLLNSFISFAGGATNVLLPSLYADGETFPSATVAPGGITLLPSLYNDGDTFETHSIGFGSPQGLTQSAVFADGDTFHAASLAATIGLLPPLYADADTFRTQTIFGGDDPNFASVELLVHFTGTNGSTSFTDESPDVRTLTAAGNSQIQSNYLELDGTTDYVTVPDSADWQFSADFTIELFGVQTDSSTTTQTLLSHWDAFTPQTNQRGWSFQWRGADTPKRFLFATSTAGSSANTANYFDYTLSTATDYTICVERSGSTVRVYVDGVMVSSATNSNSTFNSSSPLAIGTDNSRASSSSNLAELDGRIKAVRITKGVARYASDSGYVVPPLPLPSS